ncbi:hypothetical protein PSPA7 3524 [Pseudomonas aeruginosa]
MALQG